MKYQVTGLDNGGVEKTIYLNVDSEEEATLCGIEVGIIPFDVRIEARTNVENPKNLPSKHTAYMLHNAALEQTSYDKEQKKTTSQYVGQIGLEVMVFTGGLIISLIAINHFGGKSLLSIGGWGFHFATLIVLLGATALSYSLIYGILRTLTGRMWISFFVSNIAAPLLGWILVM